VPHVHDADDGRAAGQSNKAVGHDGHDAHGGRGADGRQEAGHLLQMRVDMLKAMGDVMVRYGRALQGAQ
jgi:hypothetical protein